MPFSDGVQRERLLYAKNISQPTAQSMGSLFLPATIRRGAAAHLSEKLLGAPKPVNAIHALF
jgi:hypothetical protein